MKNFRTVAVTLSALLLVGTAAAQQGNPTINPLSIPNQFTSGQQPEISVEASDPDVGGTANNGTFKGETLLNGNINGASYVDGRFGDALSFDGSDDSVNVGNEPELNISDTITMSAWVYPQPSQESDARIVSKRPGYILSLFNRKPKMFLRFNGSFQSVTAPNSLSFNEWHHVSARYDGSQMTIYVDGSPVKSVSQTGDFDTTSNPVYLGRETPATGEDYFFNGRIDGVRLYDRALTDSEINNIYQNNKYIRDGLVGFWRMDKGSGGTAFDTHHRVSRFNTPTKDRGAMSFDGSDDNVKIPHEPELNIKDTVTMSAWVYPNTNTKEMRILSKRPGYILTLTGSGQPKMFLRFNGNFQSVKAPNSLSTNQWHHIAGKYDGNKMAIYVDGSPVKNVSQTGNFDTTSNDLRIGREPPSIDDYLFNGRIDGVRLYDRALADSEISSIAQDNKVIQDGLVAWYGFQNATGEYADTRGKNILDYSVIPEVKLNVTQDGTQTTTGKLLEPVNWYDWNQKITYKLRDAFTVTDPGLIEGTIQAVDESGLTSTFKIDTIPPNIQILEPSGSTNDTKNIPIKFQATDSETSIDTSTFEYAKDGGTRISTAGNTTIDYGTTGQHTVTVFAQDQAGNEGQTTKSFTADIKNTLTANTATANTQIDTFTATFSNATDTLRKDTTTGQLNFFTTELPKGQVTVTVNSPGFEAANQTLSGVDNSFNQDLNLDLKRAGFTFNAFNEQKPEEELDPRTVTLSNSTTNKQLNRTVNTQYGDVFFTLEENTGNNIPCCGLEDGSGPTFFDQKKPGITTKEITVLTETQNNEIDDAQAQLTFFINGGQIQQSAGFNSTADVELKLDEPVKINSLRITGEAANSDTFNGEISTEIENVTFKPPQKGEVSADFKLLKNQGFPTGDVDVKVEAPAFQTRSYNTQIDSSTKTTLDTFLLPQNQGIQPSIEVRDGQQNRLENAQATVLRELGSKGTKTVAQAETATDGTAAFFLDPDVTYTLLVKKQQFGTFRGSFNPTSYEFEPLRIRLKTSSNFTESTVWDKVDFRLQPEQGTVNRTGRTEFNFSVSDPENELTQAGIKIFVDGRKVNETTVTGSSTGLSTALSQNITGLNVSQGDNLRVRGFFVKNQELEAVERSYNVLNRLSAGPFSLSKLTNTFNQGSTNITQGIIGLLILAAAGTGLNTRVGRTGGGLVTLGILGALTFLGWFTPITFLVSLLVTVGVIARG